MLPRSKAVGGNGRNDGPGIPQEQLSSIFDAFVQGPRSLDRREGGLGSASPGAVVRRRDPASPRRRAPAAAAAASSCLPLSAVDAPQVAPPVVDREVQRRRVLVVDDNVDAADMLAEALAAHGHDVARAFDAAGALTEVQSFRPDVAMLDIGLPGTDGYELAGRCAPSHRRRC